MSIIRPAALWFCLAQLGVIPGLARAQPRPLPLAHVDSTYSAEEIQAAFFALGLSLERFTYNAPYPHQLTVRVRRYVGGKLSEETGGAVLSRTAGQQTLIIYVRRHGNEVELSAGSLQGRAVLGSFSKKGYASSGSTHFDPVALVPGAAVPLMAFVANRPGQGSVALDPGAQVEGLARRYPLVVAVVAQLTGGPGGQ